MHVPRTGGWLRASACALALAACGGAAKQAAPAAPPVASSPPEAPASAQPASASECDALVAHAVDLVEREYKDDTRLSVGDRANLRALADARCRELSRANLACALAATTADAFVACDGAQAAAAR